MDVSSSPPTARNRIFMSYRRQETEYPAGWLFDRLTEHFLGAQVFKDIDSIEPGDDFVEVITSAVESCDVLLALIGDRWLTVTDEGGRRRIDDPGDFVRVEIEAALARNVRVVPILINGASMPRAHELPGSLAGLVRRQALELSASRFDADVTRLLRVLDRTLSDVRVQPATAEPLAGVAVPAQARPWAGRPAPPPGLPTTPSETPGPAGETGGGTGARPRARPPTWAIAAVVIAVVLAGLGIWVWPRGTTSSQAFVWQSVPGPTQQAPPGAIAVAAYKDQIWVAGGMDTAVRVYDPATGRWRDGPRLPAARSHGVLVSDGQRLYFMGGLNGEIRGLQTVYRLDSPDGAWTEDSPLPGGRFSGAAVWDGRRIVFAGGAELDKPRRAASDVWALESGRWARIGALASPREHLAAATDGSGTAWFLGGADVAAGSTGLSADVDVVRGSTVAPAQPLANPRQGLTAVWTSASGVCAIGGSTSQPNAAPRPVATVSCLGGGRAWPDLPRPTYLGASATVADTVYVVAGTEMFLLHLPS